MRTLDARLFQVAFQALLLTAGVLLRDFSLLPAQMALVLASATITQAFWLRFFGLRDVGYLSPLITGFGLAMLLRADSLWVHPLAALLAISAKFLLRIRGKHVFNPANFGVGVALIVLPGAWVSPGQWGNDIGIGVWLVALGALVAQRARRDDAAWLFLAVFLGLTATRLFQLGYPVERGWDVFCHQALNGALLLFAFFMISDPMTLPDHPAARRFHVLLVAVAAFTWQFLFYRPNGALWALLCLAPLVPLWDFLWPGNRHNWHGNKPLQTTLAKSGKIAR
ncbi:MAG: Na+-transporting NADH:ubiquinone oxidoreductase, subunit NqrB [Dechloromonas sp.]|uniref:Na+-transporting NADH:ubiquinone oxidoreductase, subunit NqrB n=1 Tax=Candidatus Dechloromonas phosphorivorans TaxID=2899244 RepID=A0A9D7QMF6_9RHOO|nr:Na+-transporting NADH:ubiquinone oxidoreductase, subunit NqrB [Candidatus Dechloromonas phosphorivorans]